MDTSSLFKVKGFLSKEGHNKMEYGCTGAYSLKIVECEKYEGP